MLAKAALFPLHLWLPPAHAGAPAQASAVLSARVIKAPIFLILRLVLDVAPGQMALLAGQLLAVLGAASILFCSVMALRQARLKLMIAYSTVAQLGYLFIVFPLAAGGAGGFLPLELAPHIGEVRIQRFKLRISYDRCTHLFSSVWLGPGADLAQL